MKEILGLAAANIAGGGQTVDQELTRLLADWRSDPARLPTRIGWFAYMSAAIAELAARRVASEGEELDTEVSDSEVLDALASIEAAIEEELDSGTSS